jgi:hypothetical protein
MSQNLARKMRRQLVKQALASKLAGKIEPPPAAPAADTAPRLRTVRVPMNEEQLSLLTQAQATVNQAQGQLDMVLRAICAQHHIVNGTVRQVVPGRPPKLVVDVPDEGKGKGRRR